MKKFGVGNRQLFPIPFRGRAPDLKIDDGANWVGSNSIRKEERSLGV